MIKQIALQLISELPDDVDINEIIRTLYIRLKTEQGLRDIEEGYTISQEQLKKDIEAW